MRWTGSRSRATGALVAAIVVVVAGLCTGHAAPVYPVGPGTPPAADNGPRVLRVGAGGDFPVPSAAAAVARDGDVVEIAPGDYRGDTAVWNASRLRIVGAEPRPHLRADGHDAQGKALWVVRGDDITIENVEISGTRVADRNGAAIRAEGRNLTLRNSYLHDNENGLLTGANSSSELLIDHCEFARNGNGEGFTHNLYVGAIGKLVVRQSWFHHALGGHQLKSRAAVTVVTDSRLADEADGTGSYEADFPNGGQVTLAFNILQKGPNAQNMTLVSYGAEGLAIGVDHVLVAKGNTFISQRPNGARFAYVASGTRTVKFDGNIFAGPGSLPDTPAVRANNAVQKDMPGNLDLKPEGFR